MSNLKSVGIHGTELAGYSSIVGQPIMLKNEAGNYIGQLALIGFQGDYKEAVAAIANALDAPNRHAYKVGFAAGRADALREAANWHLEVARHDGEGMEYSALVGIPISNWAELDTSVKTHEWCAREILALIEGDRP